MVVPPDDGPGFFLDGCLLSNLDWTIQRHLNRISNSCYIHTVVPPGDGPRSF